MSKFNHYAKELNEIAKASFGVYRKAEKGLKDAEDYMNKHAENPRNDAQEQIIASQAKTTYLTAKEDFDQIKKTFGEEGSSKIKQLREELENAIDREYCLKPEDIDNNTLELLKAGIMTGKEYKRLADAAEAKGNHTMSRLIGKYAEEASERSAKENGENDRETALLRSVATQSRKNTGRENLAVFDSMSSAFDRCLVNPELMNKWDDLFSDIVEAF
jgi:hypothetical protein